MTEPTCFLAQFSPVPCDGRLVRCHLIPRQTLKREMNASPAVIDDPRGWVWGCGGITGCSGHHGMLDSSRTLRIPRDRLPAEFIEFCEMLALGWFVDRTYGLPEREATTVEGCLNA